MKKTWASAFSCILLMVTSAAWGAPVPGTGQTTCYNDSVEISCPSPGQPFYGQDASYAINPMSYAKLDEYGNMLPDSATSWSMVLDNVTGLVWEMKTNKDGQRNYLDPHDADNIYFWYDSNPKTNDGDAGDPGNWDLTKPKGNTEEFIKALNDARFGGYSDWRMPTVKELAGIANYEHGEEGPAKIDHRYFTDTVPGEFWTGTTVAGNPNVAWHVDFYDGALQMAGKYAGVTSVKIPGNPYYISVTLAPTFPNRHVRAVRGGQPVGYTDHGDGTVTDNATGLTWQKAGPVDAMTWQQALAYCEGISLGGSTDWRLPTVKELQSLAHYDHVAPSIDPGYFPGTASSAYWSSTSASRRLFGQYVFDSAWAVAFNHGGTYAHSTSRATYRSAEKSTHTYVRAVRGPTNVCPGCQPVECTATIDQKWAIHIPVLEHVSLITRWDSADLTGVAASNYRLESTGAIQRPSFSCEPARTYDSPNDPSRIHIPDVLLPDGITHLWLDLDYNRVMGTYNITNGGVVPKTRLRSLEKKSSR